MTAKHSTIHEVTGDILLSKAQAIAHGVAPHDHFDSGLALSLREQWPSMHKDFRHHCHISNPEPGEAWMWGGTQGKRIVCLLTQEPCSKHGHGHPGKATVENVNHALRHLRVLAEKEKFSSIAIPRLATGVGGLHWEQVKPLVENHLGHLGIPVFVYTHYQKGTVANEPGV